MKKFIPCKDSQQSAVFIVRRRRQTNATAEGLEFLILAGGGAVCLGIQFVV